VHAKLLRVGRVQRMFGIHERRNAAQLLRLGDDLKGERGLTRRLRPEDLDDPAARHAADAERVVDADGARRNSVDRLDGPLLPEAHDGALPELFLDLAPRQFDRLHAFAVLTVVSFGGFFNSNWRHGCSLNMGKDGPPVLFGKPDNPKIVPSESQAK